MADGVRLIGAAFPRTGTMSVKRALESLGFGHCYHMQEVFLHPDHFPLWEALCDGELPEWRNIFAGYKATLDAPACLYWKELAVTYPEAKILLLRRDPEMWYESVRAIIYPVLIGSQGKADPAFRMIRRLFLENLMTGRFEDWAFAISTYHLYCEEVVEELPKSRLLVYEVSQGWAPLCSFLGYDVPQDPFPIINTRSEFQARNQLA